MSQAYPPLIVAVSGGVDSVVLLNILATADKQRLVVAHVDHGIRLESSADARFVEDLAKRYGCIYESTRLRLGAGASEEEARDARYAWLETVRAKHDADAIATAHHQDDVIETIILNLMRGTGWRGVCSLRETATRHRPLLDWDKARVVTYALEHDLQWVEDSTNDDVRLTRNYIRHGIMPRLSAQQRNVYKQLYKKQCKLREQIEAEDAALLKKYTDKGSIKRYPLIMAPNSVARELVRAWLPVPLETKRLRELLLFAKTAKPGAKWSLDKGQFVEAESRQLIVRAPRD